MRRFSILYLLQNRNLYLVKEINFSIRLIHRTLFIVECPSGSVTVLPAHVTLKATFALGYVLALGTLELDSCPNVLVLYMAGNISFASQQLVAWVASETLLFLGDIFSYE